MFDWIYIALNAKSTDNSWLDNPWLVQIIGGIISGLVVGLSLTWLSKKIASLGRADSHFKVSRVIEILGYFLLLPAFLGAFILSIPLFAGLYMTESARSCRYTPTCKDYLIRAVDVHGLIPGFIMGFQRVARCNPWSKGGYDPVPPPRGG